MGTSTGISSAEQVHLPTLVNLCGTLTLSVPSCLKHCRLLSNHQKVLKHKNQEKSKWLQTTAGDRTSSSAVSKTVCVNSVIQNKREKMPLPICHAENSLFCGHFTTAISLLSKI